MCNLCGELIYRREPGGRGMTMRPGGYRAPARSGSSLGTTLVLLAALALVVFLIIRYAL